MVKNQIGGVSAKEPPGGRQKNECPGEPLTLTGRRSNMKPFSEYYQIPTPDSRLMFFLKLHRNKLIRSLETQFIPEVSLQLDAVDALLDAKGGRV